MKSHARTSAFVAIATAALVVTGCTASAPEGPAGSGEVGDWEPEWVDGVLQPLPSGWPDDSLAIIVTDEDGAGSDDGIYARHLQAALNDLAPVRVDIFDRPDLDAGYGVWDGSVFLADDARGREGNQLLVYALAGSTVDLLATPLTRDLGVELGDLNYVMTTEELPWLMVTRTGAPWGNSFSEMIEHARANPGEVKFITRGPGSASDLGLWAYLVSEGVEVNAVVGGSHEENLLAIGAGVGDIAISLAGATRPFVEDGRVLLLSCVGNANPCAGDWDSPVPNAATALETGEVDPWGANRGVAVTTTTPELHHAWLTELLRGATEHAGFRESRGSLPGLTMTARDRAETLALAEEVYEIAREVLGRIGGLDSTVR